jgi:hypothetical protein
MQVWGCRFGLADLDLGALIPRDQRSRLPWCLLACAGWPIENCIGLKYGLILRFVDWSAVFICTLT